jgi:NADH-quinone oxidoreductase subunit N
LGYKITAAPFHFYAPDVFNGAPLSGAALLAFLPKAAGFVTLLRLASETMLAPSVGERTWSLVGTSTLLFGVLAVLTMFTGNLLGLLQDNVKRMLAYSSVAHTGYMLVGLAAGPPAGSGVSGTEAVLFYLAVYGSMTLGIFAVLAALDRPGKPMETIGDFAGLSQTHPMLALMAAVCLFSLTGLPPTAGFWGKLYLFFAAWSQGGFWLRVVAVLLALNAAVGSWYYLRIVGSMYLNSPKEPTRTFADRPATLAVVFCSIAVIGLFLAPNFVWRWTEQAQAVVASR